MNKSVIDLINNIHSECYKLCKEIFNEYFSNSGNVAIFCQSEDQYAELIKIRNELTFPSEDPNQKYFTLVNPINIPANNNIPSAEYKFLYIRKPEESNYGKNLGDIDFVLDCEDYQKLKSEVIAGKYSGASIYNRPGWDNIQLSLPQFNVVSYISTAEMAEKVRVKFD